MRHREITVERLKAVLTYDAGSGVFRWVVSRRCARAGDIAGGKNPKGYWRVRIDGVLYYGHILAWLYMTGEWPVADVDHANRNPADNRWENLRAATRKQNQGNQGLGWKNSTGLKGAQRYGKRFRAMLRINGKNTHLGLFDTAEEAHAAYMEAARREFGDFASAA